MPRHRAPALPSAFDVPPPGVPEVQEELYVTRDGAGVKALARLPGPPRPRALSANTRSRRGWRGRRTGPTQGRTDATSLEIRDIAPGAWEFRVKALSVLGVSSDWRMVVGRDPRAFGTARRTYGSDAADRRRPRHSQMAAQPGADVRLGGNIVIRHSGERRPRAGSRELFDGPGVRQRGDRGAAAEARRLSSARRGQRRAARADGRSVATAGAQALAFAPLTHLEAAPQFSGTHAGTATRDGALTLGAATMLDDWSDVDAVASFDWEGGVVPEGIYSFAAGIDFGAVTRARLAQRHRGGGLCRLRPD